MDAIKTFRTDKYILKIFTDVDPINPQTEYDLLGTMICWHNRYNLGNTHDFESPEDFRDSLDKDDIVFPLFLYDHSGITISMTPFNCPWDSGQVGYIYITKEKIIEEYGEYTPENIELAKKCLKAEVNIYDLYLTGQVYGYEVHDFCDCCKQENVCVDSCWGFFGSDLKENGLIENISVGEIEEDKKLRELILKDMGE